MIIFETDTDRNLGSLQSSIDDLVSELATFKGKTTVKAQLIDLLSRLIRTKERLVRETFKSRSTAEKLLTYLMRKGPIDRHTLIRAGFDGAANTAEIDKAIETLKAVGVLDILPARRRSKTIYKLVEPKKVAEEDAQGV